MLRRLIRAETVWPWRSPNVASGILATELLGVVLLAQDGRQLYTASSACYSDRSRNTNVANYRGRVLACGNDFELRIWSIAIPCLLIGLIYAAVAGMIYVQWDEHRMSRLYNLDFRIREYRRMRHEKHSQGGNQSWWEDG